MTSEQYHLGCYNSQQVKKATNETSTQVATCMINKWMAKIDGNEVYNIRGRLGMGDGKRID